MSDLWELWAEEQGDRDRTLPPDLAAHGRGRVAELDAAIGALEPATLAGYGLELSLGGTVADRIGELAELRRRWLAALAEHGLEELWARNTRWWRAARPTNLLEWAINYLDNLVSSWESLQRMPLSGLGLEWAGGGIASDRVQELALEMPRWQRAIAAVERARLTLVCPTCTGRGRSVDWCDHGCGDQWLARCCVLPAGHRGPHMHLAPAPDGGASAEPGAILQAAPAAAGRNPLPPTGDAPRVAIFCAGCLSALKEGEECSRCCGAETPLGRCVLAAGHEGPHVGPEVRREFVRG